MSKPLGMRRLKNLTPVHMYKHPVNKIGMFLIKKVRSFEGGTVNSEDHFGSTNGNPSINTPKIVLTKPIVFNIVLLFILDSPLLLRTCWGIMFGCLVRFAVA